MTDNQKEDNYSITIRPITELSELRHCIDLQQETWGLADVEIVPLRMLVTQNRVGGLVLGAFDHDRLIGFLNAMTSASTSSALSSDSKGKSLNVPNGVGMLVSATFLAFMSA